MLDNDTRYTLTLEVPGVSPQDVVIEVKDSRLTIKGETSTTKRTHFRVNCSVMLPTDADANEATATCVDGILHVQVPKKADVAPTCITVSADAETSEEASSGDERPYKITLVAAGLAASDVEATIDSCGALTIKGETKRTGVKVARCFQLPRDADSANAMVRHVDGILTVTVPKKQKVEPTYVNVMVTTGEPSAKEEHAPPPSSLVASEEQVNEPENTSSVGDVEDTVDEDEDAVMV